jgi:parallel beta helix pectate lyase-like protein
MSEIVVSLAAALFLALASVGLAGADGPLARRYFVAPGGSDAWSGKRPAPNRQRTDGPFATPERARDEIRKLKQNGGLPTGGVTVEVRGGVYPREQPFELTGADSGDEGSPVVYRAYRGEAVGLIGGKQVTGFRPVTDPAVLERLDATARGHVLAADLRALGITDFGSAKGGGLELFFQHRPMMLARWPNEGFVRIVDVIGGEPVDIRGTKGDRIGKFVYEGDVWLHGYWFWDWSDERQKVQSIDTERHSIRLVPPYHSYGYRKGQWFYAYNLLAELDRPGEWYLDRETGMLYFWPPAPIENGAATVSVLPSLVTMRDVSHVTLRGMTLEAARGTAVTIVGGGQNQIVGCTIQNVGGWAVKIAGGTDHRVVGCDICETGDGGIALEGGDRKTLTPARHLAENNHIHHYSRWNRMYQPAISLDGVGNRAAHNLIHDAPHEAIAFGGNDHVIEFNEIHHVCTESNDAGAIYAGRDWTMRGTVIRHNYLHQITGFEERGCVGVYLDDMFCGTTIAGNVFYQVTRAAFIGGGRDNRVENNVFVECQPALHVDARAQGWAADTVDTTMKERLLAMPYQQPPWRARYPQLVPILDEDPPAPRGNVIIHNICWRGRWDEIEDSARPLLRFVDNLLNEDPHFVDAAKHGFQLRRDSPAYRLGFQRIPIERIGLYKDVRRASWPVREASSP